MECALSIVYTPTCKQSTVHVDCSCQRLAPASDGSETRRVVGASEAIAPCCSIGRACLAALGHAAAIRQIAFYQPRMDLTVSLLMVASRSVGLTDEKMHLHSEYCVEGFVLQQMTHHQGLKQQDTHTTFTSFASMRRASFSSGVANGPSHDHRCLLLTSICLHRSQQPSAARSVHYLDPPCTSSRLIMEDTRPAAFGAPRWIYLFSGRARGRKSERAAKKKLGAHYVTTKAIRLRLDYCYDYHRYLDHHSP